MILQEHKRYRLKTDDGDTLDFYPTIVDRTTNTVTTVVYAQNGEKRTPTVMFVDLESAESSGNIEEIIQHESAHSTQN